MNARRVTGPLALAALALLAPWLRAAEEEKPAVTVPARVLIPVGGTTDFEGVPSFIFDPIVVTMETVADTVVADGFWSVDEICTKEYADACADAGLQ